MEGPSRLGMLAELDRPFLNPRTGPDVVALVTLATVGVLIAVGGLVPYAAVLLVLALGWVGLTRPPRTLLLLAPATLIAVLLPALTSARLREATLPLAVGAAALLTAWVTARTMTQLRDDRRLRLGQVEELEALVGSAALLHREADADRVGGLVARLAVTLLGGTSSRVLLADHDGEFLLAGEEATDGVSVGLDPSDPAFEEVVSSGRVRRMGLATGWEVLVIPLLGTRRTHGVVAVLREADDDASGALSGQAARLFGYQAGLALERLQVIERLTEEALRDPLTGVGSRRFAELLLGGLEDGDAVILLDLDRFKDVNDELGHVEGDAALAALGGYLQERLRLEDAVARYGGDEFLVVLRGAAKGAPTAAERLLDGWRSLEPRTSFSGGVAVHDGDDDPRSTLKRADQALYRAKDSGRDRVVEARDGICPEDPLPET